MTFQFGPDAAKDLTRDQVLEQCAMLIALARFVQRFGLSAVGVQYQQGLAQSCAASDFAEGAIGSAERFPIPDADGNDHPPRPADPLHQRSGHGQRPFRRPCSGACSVPWACPPQTTLHDIRWGSEFEGTFFWDLEISGAVPFEHLKGGIAGAEGYRQPAMYFPKGGATITGQGKAGRILWARAHYPGTQVLLHVGTGTAVELPAPEFERRRRATTYEWPMLNCALDGVGRDDLMAGHQSNHITVAYVDEAKLAQVLQAFVAQALTQDMKVFVCGTAHEHLQP